MLNKMLHVLCSFLYIRFLNKMLKKEAQKKIPKMMLKKKMPKKKMLKKRCTKNIPVRILIREETH